MSEIRQVGDLSKFETKFQHQGIVAVRTNFKTHLFKDIMRYLYGGRLISSFKFVQIKLPAFFLESLSIPSTQWVLWGFPGIPWNWNSLINSGSNIWILQIHSPAFTTPIVKSIKLSGIYMGKLIIFLVTLTSSMSVDNNTEQEIKYKFEQIF